MADIGTVNSTGADIGTVENPAPVAGASSHAWLAALIAYRSIFPHILR
jgi:hypothetical protein